MKTFTDAKRVAAYLRKTNCIIYTFGNGGSASIANHMACDWMKGTYDPNGFILKVISLCSNMPLITALANDFGYEETCAKQIEYLCHSKNTLILISSSGKSANVVKAAIKAKKLGLTVIGFTGFDGGLLKPLSDISVHLDSDDYGEVEDYHSQVMHEVARQLRDRA